MGLFPGVFLFLPKVGLPTSQPQVQPFFSTQAFIAIREGPRRLAALRGEIVPSLEFAASEVGKDFEICP